MLTKLKIDANIFKPFPKPIYYPSLFFGSLFIALNAKNLLGFFFKKFVRPKKNLLKRYGEKTWALVTGASDGIGKAFCEELSKIGFNICLMGRNKQKLEQVENELKIINPNIQTRIVIADFSHSYEEALFTQISEEIKDLDISMLINNAGTSVGAGEIQNQSLNSMKEIIAINSLAPMMMIKLLTQKMINRNFRSAIINVGSIGGIIPSRYGSLYCGSKGFVDLLTLSLKLDFENNPKNKIDLLILRPCFVSTRMAEYPRVKNFVISSKSCVLGCLKDLGYELGTAGHWKHCIETWFRKRFNMPYKSKLAD